MTQNTNLNVSPYFDDFEDSKNYNKVLFKPGFPIQARELTTLQSILHNQIEKFGQYFFKEGSVVIPGGVTYDTNYTSVRIESSYLNVNVNAYTDVLATKNIRIKGETSGVIATVVNKLTEVESIDKFDTLYVKYTSSGTDNSTREFLDGENLITLSDIDYSNTKIEANATFAKCIDSGATKTGSSSSIAEGIYFIRGYFVKVPGETLILDQYTNSPSYKVGFSVTEKIITATSVNKDLYDNAQGFSNEAAPGADRFSIEIKLGKKLLTDADDKNFIELIRVQNGEIFKFEKGDDPQFAYVEDALAKRTFDESGNYYVKPFSIDVRESLNDRLGNRGLFFENELTQNGNTPSDDFFCLNISPGRAYVKGYRIDNPYTTALDVPKTRTIQSKENATLPIQIGNVVEINNTFGSPITGYGTTQSTVNLLNKRLADTKYPESGTEVIGKARVYDWNQNSSGISTTYEVRLFDITTFSKVSLSLEATVQENDHVKGKYSGASGFVNFAPGTESIAGIGTTTTSLTLQDVKGSFQVNEPIILNGKEVGRNVGVVTDYAFDDIKAIHRNSEGLGVIGQVGVNTFAADLSLSRKQAFDPGIEFHVPAATGALHGSAVNVTAVNVRDFRNYIKVGDLISYGGTNENVYQDVNVNQVTAIGVGGTNFTMAGIATVAGVCNGAVKSITPTGLEVLVPTLRQASDPGFRVDFPEDYISSVNLLDSSYIIKKQFTTTSSATGTIVLTASDIGDDDLYFEPFTEDNYILTKVTGEKVDLYSSQVTIAAGNKQITITGIVDGGVVANRTHTLTATLKRTKLASKEKSITRCRSLIVDKSSETGAGIGTTTFNDGLTYDRTYGLRVQDEEISLNYPDIHRVLAVFESNDNSAAQVPSITVNNASDVFNNNNVVIGEQFIGNTSGALARVVTVPNATKLEFVYENQNQFEIGETITLKTSGIVADINILQKGDRNIAKNYDLDKGHRKEYVDIGRIIRKKSTDAPTRQLKIILDHYSNVEVAGTIETVSSYTGLDYRTEIPFVVDARASDFMDLRPRVASYSGSGSPFSFNNRDFTASGNENLATNQTVVADYGFYLGRKDRLYLTTDGTFELKQGEPSLYPKEPLPSDDGMEVARFTLKPYMLKPNKSMITEIIPHRRYTMKDIGSLESRIKNLEEYTTLSLLETDTKNLILKDENTGLDKFKSGFYVDNFRNHNSHDFTGESKFDIDIQRAECRPRSTERNVTLIYETEASTLDPINTDYRWTNFEIESNLTKRGTGVTLAYSEEEFLNQPLATRVENLNPYLVSRYTGTLELTPSTDYWIDEFLSDTPEVIRMGDDIFQAFAMVLGVDDRENGGMAGAMWQTSDTVWGGTSTTTSTRTEDISLQFNEIDRGGFASPGLTGDWNLTWEQTGTRVTTTSTTTQSGEDRDFNLELTARVEETQLGNKVTGIENLFHCRSRNIEVVGTRLKPNTRYYVFMENQDVTRWCVPKLIPITMVSGSFKTGDIIRDVGVSAAVLGQASISFRAAQANHKLGEWNNPVQTYATEPYTQSTLGSTYSSTSSTINVDTFDLADFRAQSRRGFINNGMQLANADGTGEATVALRDGVIELISDEFGNLLFSLHIPEPSVATNPKFNTGLSSIKVTSSATNELILDPGEAFAEAQYLAAGQQVNSVQQTLSIRNPVVERIQTASRARSRVVGSSSNSRNNWTDSQVVAVEAINIQETGPWSDPLAQSFMVPGKYYQDGLFLTGGELFFKTKDETTPVTVQIRELDEGGRPGQTILPFSTTEINPAGVEVSTDGSVGTGFTFTTPVYLRPQGTYAILLFAPASLGWNAFVTRMNEPDLISGRLNDKQPSMGSLFKSQNAQLWTESQQEDLKFRLTKANFVTGTNSLVLTNNDLPLGHIRKVNPITAYSKRQTVSIAATTRIFEQGTTIEQTVSNVTTNGSVFATGGPIDIINGPGIAVTFSHRNTGIGITPTAGVLEYDNVTFTSLSGFGQNAKATVRVAGGTVDRITMTDGGTGYAVGDVLISGNVGFTGSAIRAVVGVVTTTNTIILDNVDSATQVPGAPGIQAGTAVTHYLGNGVKNSVAITPTAVTNDAIRDGLTMFVDHKNHGMHGDNNKLKIEDFESEFAPVILQERIDSDTTVIKVDTVGILTNFEGSPVGAANSGYIKIGKEIISYESADSSTNQLTNITRAIDNSLQSTHDANADVAKYEFSGVSLRKINKTHSIDTRTRTFDNYYVKLSDNDKMFAFTKTGGGGQVKISQNIPFEAITPKINVITPTGTNVIGRMKSTSGTSISGSEISFKDEGYEPISLNSINILDTPRVVASKTNEYELLNDSKSLAIELQLATANPDVSPMVDIDTANIIAHSNIIDSNVSDYTTDNRPRIVGQDPNSGIYETKRINLEFSSNSLYVQFDGHREANADFKVFYQLFRDDSQDSQQTYSPFNTDGSSDKLINPNKKENGFSEYKYTINNTPQFTGFKIKVIMTSTDQAKPPRMKNFRAIALRAYEIDS